MVRNILFLLMVASLSACKLIVMVPRGGEVQSFSSGTCPELTNCVHDVTDVTYTEGFTAVPAPGFQFLKWNTGGNFNCEDSTNPTCVVTTTLLAGIVPNATIADFPEDFYIMPIFSGKVPIAAEDTLLVNNKVWAQPDLFTGLSWNDINAVCPEYPSGVCNGSLNGWDMTGWTWASVQDVNLLFNVYLDPVVLGPMTPDIHQEIDPSPWEEAFFAAGWRPTQGSGISYKGIRGWMRTSGGLPNALQAMLDDELTLFDYDTVTTGELVDKGLSDNFTGAWFFRLP